MIELRLGLADVARVRFARSPMDELVHSVNVLAGRKGSGMHQRWEAMARSRIAGLDLSLVDALVGGTSYHPDFLMPPPQGWDSNIVEELDRVRAAGDEDVRRCLDICWPDGEIPRVARKLYDNPKAELGNLVGMLAAYWAAAIEPVWERLCAVHEADLGYRSNLLTSGGVDRLFADLHPKVSYVDDRVQVKLARHDYLHEVNGAGVLLVPCVFIWPKLTVTDLEPYQPTITYAARGSATSGQPLWTQRKHRSPS